MRRSWSSFAAALLMLLFFDNPLFAQPNAVHGRVADSTGTALAYATVQVKGTRKAVAADASGHFTINAASGDILLATATGYLPAAITVPENPSNLSIVLQGSSLQQVVVTALGIRRTRNSLPYATQQITAADLNRTATTNVVNNLSGKIAGLQISSSNALGGASNVILRGYKSLTQTNQALFVVDGVPYDNTTQNQSGYDLGNAASDINADDIESVTVLKGAAASALYGSRASNGVIMINTKKGGNTNGNLGISVNENIAVGSVDKTTLPAYQTQYGQGYGSSGYNSAYPSQTGFF